MLGHCLPRHVEQLTQLAERLPIVLVQFVEQFSTARIGQRFEHFIHDRLTICNLMVACQARKLIALYARDARSRRLQPNSAFPSGSGRNEEVTPQGSKLTNIYIASNLLQLTFVLESDFINLCSSLASALGASISWEMGTNNTPPLQPCFRARSQY